MYIGVPAPTNVKAIVSASRADSAEVTWDQSSDFTGYLVTCISSASYAGAKVEIVKDGDTTSYTLTNLVENTPYDITVQGLTKDGTKSDYSKQISIRTRKAGMYVKYVVHNQIM